MGIVVGYFIGVSFPSVSLTKVTSDSWIYFHCKNHYLILSDILQVTLPSSIYSPFDKTMHEDQSKSHERSFPENLGSGNTPEIPKVYFPRIFCANFDTIAC